MLNKWVLKLNQVLEGFGGYSLQFQLLEDLSENDWHIESLRDFQRRQQAPPYIEGRQSGAYGFPVFVGTRLTGIVITSSIEVASSDRLIQLSDFVTLIIETSLSSQEQIEFLDQIEQRLLAQNNSENVVAFRKKSEPLELSDEEDDFDWESSTADRSAHHHSGHDIEGMQKPLLLYVPAKLPLERVAVEIHQQTKRWAFLSVDDLPEDIFESPETLRGLGTVTLFVRELSQLSPNQKTTLSTYLESYDNQEGPLLIIGTTESPEQLRESGKLRADLLRKFSVAHLQWDEHDPMQPMPRHLASAIRILAARQKTDAETGPTAEAFMHLSRSHQNSESPTLH